MISRFPRPARLAIPILILAIGAVFLFREPAPSPELATPVIALRRLEPLSGKSLYFTPVVTGLLKERRDAATEFEAVSQNPAAWRALDRRLRFSAVWLAGDPAAYRALLDHLRKSPDWTLSWLDHTGYIFEHSPARAWSRADLAGLLDVFQKHPVRERVAVRVQAAHRLMPVGENAAAKSLLDGAVALDKKSAPAWAELACLHASQGKWNDALAAADRALGLNKNYPPAAAAKANALYAFGKFNDALQLTRGLVEAAPQDGVNLALHARVAHAAHAFQEEIVALETIVRMSLAKALPVGTWRVFLAQAYAADGRATDALGQFEAAINEPGLPESERAFAEKGITRIKSRDPVF